MTININDKTLQCKIIVDSGARLNYEQGTNSNFLFQFDDLSEYSSVSLLRASIPKTYYMVKDNYFTLIEGSLDEHGAVAITSVNISMQKGNYSIIAFKDALQTLLTEKSPNNYVYNLDANIFQTVRRVNTGKFTITVQLPPGAPQPQIRMYNTIYDLIGFEKNTLYTFTNNKLECPNIYNMNLKSTLFIHSNICLNPTSSVLQEIYTTDSETSSYIVFENYMATIDKSIINPIAKTGANTYYFQLTDEDGNIIDLNGGKMTFSLLFMK